MNTENPPPSNFDIASKQAVKSSVYRIVRMQLVGISLLALIATLFDSVWTGFALLTGGMAYGLPTLLFAWIFLRGGRRPEQFIFFFFLGEVAKLFSSAALFTLAIHELSLNLPAALGGFIAGIAFFWIASLHYLLKKNS